jgi:hypothetical protein
MAEKADDRKGEPSCGRTVPDGKLTARVPRQRRTVCARDLECDLRSGIARADHENRAVRQLAGVSVLAGMQLDDPRVEVGCEVGNLGHPVGAGGHHDVIGLEKLVAVLDHVPAVPAGHAGHLDTGPGRQLEAVRVGLEVVGHVVLRGEGVRGGRDGPARQP